MPVITKDDLERHIYIENIDEITRGDDAKVIKAINAAIGQVKSYLRQYDLAKLFSLEVEDDNLVDKVIDIAAWNLCKLCNANVNLELFKTLKDDAVDWFRDVMKGQADPDGWPYKEDNPETPYVENSSTGWSSNRKRKQHF
jgi:phage gp36-like protein